MFSCPAWGHWMGLNPARPGPNPCHRAATPPRRRQDNFPPHLSPLTESVLAAGSITGPNQISRSAPLWGPVFGFLRRQNVEDTSAWVRETSISNWRQDHRFHPLKLLFSLCFRVHERLLWHQTHLYNSLHTHCHSVWTHDNPVCRVKLIFQHLQGHFLHPLTPVQAFHYIIHIHYSAFILNTKHTIQHI